MKSNRWMVVAVALVVMVGQIAMAGPGRRRSAVGDNKFEYEGIIKTAAADSLVVTTSHKEDVTVALTDKTVIRHGETTIAAADLKPGERVHVRATTVDTVTTATLVLVQDENDDNSGDIGVSGIVKSVGTDSLVVTTATGDVTVNVDANTVLREKSQAITLADIKVGDRVEAEGTKVDDHTLLAKHIQVEEIETEISGVVKSVGTDSLVVTTSSGDVTVQVDSSTEIRKKGSDIALSDIKAGDHVEAEGTLVDPTTLEASKISVEGGH
jgi:hypothetical protein